MDGVILPLGQEYTITVTQLAALFFDLNPAGAFGDQDQFVSFMTMQSGCMGVRTLFNAGGYPIRLSDETVVGIYFVHELKV